MGILNSGDYSPEGVEKDFKSIRECKPDYEALIKKAGDKSEKAIAFKRAIFDFLEDRRIPEALVVVVGELDFEIFGLEKTIERLIEQQESAK